MTDKERMFQAEMINHQLERLQEYLARMDKQTAEVTALKSALDQFKTIEEGEEMLVPLAAGVFMKATSTGDKLLHVNVGQNTIVAKSPDQVHKMLDEQLAEMRQYEEELHAQYDQLLADLEKIEKEFRE